MKLKIPLPHRPTGVSIESTAQGITITWNAATDCNGNPVFGYNVYRSTSPDGEYTKVNSVLIVDTEYTDTSAEDGTRYYYVVRAVDGDGDESVQSLKLSLLAGIGTGSGPAGSGGSCFISALACNVSSGELSGTGIMKLFVSIGLLLIVEGAREMLGRLRQLRKRVMRTEC